MSVDLHLTWVFTFLLISIRLAVVFYATPMDGLRRIPQQIRLFIILALAFSFTQLLDIQSYQFDLTVYELAVAALNEVVLGLLMAFGLYAAFASFMLAGKLIDLQAGFGAAEIMNPSSNVASPLFGTILSMLAVLLFFISQAHHMLFRGLAYSLELVPPGQSVTDIGMDAVLQQFGNMFIYGVIIAAPIIGVLLLVDTATAVMGKSMPQLNVYFLFLPLKIFITLIMCAFAIRFLSPVFEKVFLSAFEHMQRVVY